MEIVEVTVDVRTGISLTRLLQLQRELGQGHRVPLGE